MQTPERESERGEGRRERKRELSVEQRGEHRVVNAQEL